MTHRRQLIRNVERSHALVAGSLVVVAALTLPAGIWWSLGVGALIGAANFRAMAAITDRLTQPDLARRGGMGLWMAGKLLGLIAAVGATLWWLEPQPVGLVIGLSLAPACLMGVAAVQLGRRGGQGRASTGEVI